MSNSPKEILFAEDARQKLVSGIRKLTDVIACTLGPKGRNVGLEKSWGAPAITSDGNQILKEIDLQDEYENMGVEFVKEVGAKTKERCGDGTTTGAILLRALVEAGVKNIESGASPIEVKRGLDQAVEAVITEIDKRAIQIESNEEIANIATASASGDSQVGAMVAQAIEKVGREGVVTVEEGKSTSTEVETVEGMRFDRGYLSGYFCTDADKMTVEMQQPQILLTDKKISSIHDLLGLLQNAASTGNEMLIIAEDLEGDVLSTLVVNRLRGTLKVAAVKAPGFGERRKAMLEDIAALTGGTVVCEDTGVTLKDAPAEVLGTAERVIITKEHTTIINGGGSQSAIKSRIQQIGNELEAASSKYDKEKLQERKAKLSGGVAVIRVGASTEVEVKSLKQRFEDAVSSTMAALEEGVVPGGGIALMQCSQALTELKLEGDQGLGVKLMSKAAKAPCAQLASNAGFDSQVVLAEIKEKGGQFGFNVLTEKVEDLVAAGVVDPVKVVKASLRHAASAAGVVLISEALVIDAPEDEEDNA